MNGQMVIPIFYHVNPSDVRKQTGNFENAFVKHEKCFKELTKKIQRWKDALTEASNLSGWDSMVIRPDSKLVEETVKDVLKKLNYRSPSSHWKDLVGIDSHIEEVVSLLCIGKLDFRVVGIWGMGGIGKTTIVEAVFREISSHFEGCSFIANVGEESEKCGGLVQLREQILSSILEEENLQIGIAYNIPQFMKHIIQCKKVFIILDEVNDIEHLAVLTRGLDGFGLGSRVIITTRDKQVLRNYGVEHIYEVKGYYDYEALQIFSNCALKQNRPLEDFRVLSKEIIDYCKSNPLALKVLGSSLYRRSKRDWQSALGKLKRISNPKIHNVLKISYDGLDDEEKNIFLEIACFIKRWDINYVIDILSRYYTSPYFGLNVLLDKSLVTKSRNLLDMHDLLQEMGWEIVHQESLKEPGNRSRLWYHEDVFHVLKNNTGTHTVEGMCLDMNKIRDVNLSSRAFANMHNLRFLKFYTSRLSEELVNISKVHLPEELDYLSEELTYLRWDGYPFKTLPSNFNPTNLHELHLPYSNLEQLWEGTTHAFKLELIDLHHSQRLIGIPDLLDAPLLEIINLECCKSLLDVPSSIQYLDNLHVKISGDRIEKLDFSGSAIEEVPSSIQYIKSQRVVILRECKNLKTIESNIHFESHVNLNLSYCINLTKFPQISGNVVDLDLFGTAIKEIPSSVDCLTELHALYLRDCTRLKSISSSICKLKSLSELDLSGCRKLQSFPEILEKMEHLEYLSLCRATVIIELPSSIEGLNGLRRLRMRDCKNLETIPSSICNLTSLIEIDAYGCLKLNKLPENLIHLKTLNVRETAISQLPSCIPSWKGIEFLDCPNCRGLILPQLSSLCSLETLYLPFCNQTEIPDDLCNLTSLETLDLSGNNFKNLPLGIKQLSHLNALYLGNCNMLQSVPELPFSLIFLEANNCKMLYSLPEPPSSLNELDAPESEISRTTIEFIFTNCLSLNQKVYNNILENIASLRLCYEKLYKQTPKISYCIPGSEIPNWFSFQSSGSSIIIELPQHLSNKSFMGVAICAVIAFEEP
ncbi:disease resistance protein RPP2B-like [Pistacia vera]|uniref:disease resistance protein RPP2B-like n=1 Tax=Pistacia vera TaxID=55513 RepID=UPI0012639936|nr:disease resistance protein RPP2B-like [Pistacia vera]